MLSDSKSLEIPHIFLNLELVAAFDSEHEAGVVIVSLHKCVQIVIGTLTKDESSQPGKAKKKAMPVVPFSILMSLVTHVDQWFLY